MILIRGARQLLTLRGPSPPRRGLQLSDLSIIPDGAILIDGERIDSVGPTRRIENLSKARSVTVIDATGKVVLPGFVDSHTRLVFSTPPPRDLDGVLAAERRRSAPGPTPPAPPFQPLSKASPKVLRLRARRWARLFASQGTTTLEARSGYGLSLPSEVKGLRVAKALDQAPLEVVSTFLANNANHPGPLVEDAVEQVVEVLLPILRRRRLATFCDVECGPGAFHCEDARRILEAARRLGFGLKIQAERAARTGGARLAVEMKAASADHLSFITEADIDALAGSDTIATLLPAAVYVSGGERFPPARQLADRGAAVALATGFGPDCGATLSMSTVLSLACSRMSLMPEEAISAATINGAAAVGRADQIGSLEPGKQADLAMFDVGDYREIPYYFGVNLCVMAMKRGRVIYSAPDATGGSGPEPNEAAESRTMSRVNDRLARVSLRSSRVT